MTKIMKLVSSLLQKTIPGNTYLKQNSKEKFKIINRLNNKETNKPYKFIVGNTVSDISYKLFLKMLS